MGIFTFQKFLVSIAVISTKNKHSWSIIYKITSQVWFKNCKMNKTNRKNRTSLSRYQFYTFAYILHFDSTHFNDFFNAKSKYVNKFSIWVATLILKRLIRSYFSLDRNNSAADQQLLKVSTTMFISCML